MSGDGLDLLYLEDGRSDDKYKQGGLEEWDHKYYEEFHNVGTSSLQGALESPLSPPVPKGLSREEQKALIKGQFFPLENKEEWVDFNTSVALGKLD